MTEYELKPPTPPTLRKYGMSEEQFWALAKSQDYKCAVCGKLMASGRYNIDHKHVRGWKHMKPEQRIEYVRGILCWWCNYKVLLHGNTAERLRAAADYLDRSERNEVQWR